MTMDVLMRLDRVTKTYHMGEITVNALRETSLDVYQGEILVILGPSGSGKSTLLNIMGGMDLPTTGEMLFLNENLSLAGDKRLTNYRRNEIGFVFQFYNLIPDLTARENVELAADLVDEPLDVLDVLKDVGLADRMDHFPSQMSGGEQQRVSIARAAVKNPRLLLCDEPTGALDYQTGKLILALLVKINRDRGSTVVIVTHNTPIGDMAHRVVRMRDGAIADIRENVTPLPPERIEW
ncbi:ABC transporter ATP-binding protein [Desulfoscipio gibsoniae]|uniref:ABC-type antimicrobial peptide transport system, ATPase component n=1 Tax=Desulfoscipio gibsoniae DSM 7213 TaxID=767817 RepID=R4KGT2_9FIRM|nr:ABC transporter ATP-binding protein [Desulfoscipio gibsoniae]AGL02408.1 ABC-type antimicrobial peptide transport system, ATPase component [Desulfoscipio gibsoniae DSM 7213]